MTIAAQAPNPAQGLSGPEDDHDDHCDTQDRIKEC